MIANSRLSPTKVEEFKKEYLEGRERIGAAVKIFRHFDAFKRINECSNEAPIGFNVPVRMAAFTENSGEATLDAWSFAVAQERSLLCILEQRLAACVQATGQIGRSEVARTPADILAAADRLSKRPDRAGYEPGLVVIAAAVGVDFYMELPKNVDTDYRELPHELNTNWILGSHHGRLILNVAGTELSALYVVDVRRFGSLVQFSPPVQLTVEPASITAGAKQSIEDPLEKVQLRLYQSYEFRVDDERAVWGAKLAPSS